MHIETKDRESKDFAGADGAAYARLEEHWSEVLRVLESCDIGDEKGWTEVTEHSPEFFRKSFGI